MPTTILQFRADLQAFAEKLNVSKQQTVQKVALDLWRGITTRTPVLTGRARANWFLTQGSPSTQVDEYPNAKPGEVPFPPEPDVSAITGDESVFIINNLPYIESLENGHSKKAPNGMVAVTIASEEASIDAGLGNAYEQNAGQFEA
jgi:hypothetical protein